MKKIAWGFSKLFQMHIQSTQDTFSYCIDSRPSCPEFSGIPVCLPERLNQEVPGTFKVIIFAASNAALVAISNILANRGLLYGKDFEFYSDYFWNDYQEKLSRDLGLQASAANYRYVLAYTLNSRKPIHTTILGSHLFLQLLEKVQELPGGAIAEVGAFEGGNAYCALNHPQYPQSVPYYIIDSFEGFPELHSEDPDTFQKGDYSTGVPYPEIVRDFSLFPQASVIKGFVPEAFKHVHDARFSLVFYDCDLYQPALDTFAFFWDKIIPGGYLLIHDYESEKGGFEGVKNATQLFFKDQVKVTSFYQNTMAVIQKSHVS